MKRPAAAGSRIQDTSGLSCQCSATEPRQPDNHQPSKSCTGGAECLSRTPGSHSVCASLFTFLYFRLITSKFFYFRREARCSEQVPHGSYQHSTCGSECSAYHNRVIHLSMLPRSNLVQILFSIKLRHFSRACFKHAQLQVNKPIKAVVKIHFGCQY